MDPASPSKPKVFVDADVLFAGAASPSEHSASLLILSMAELTLIDAITTHQVITEAELNLGEKIPKALPAFRLLVSRCLRIVDDPPPVEFNAFRNAADPKDLPMLVAAHREGCRFLTTFNISDYQPGIPGVMILKPGDLVMRIRYLLARLAPEEGD
jgi:hypothetical protein